MDHTQDGTKKLVVLTKESKFFVPEKRSPVPTRSVPKTDAPFKDGDEFRGLESSFEEETDSSYRGDESLDKKPSFWSYQGSCLFGICVILLVLLCLLLVYSRRDASSSPLLHSTVVAALAGTLGYAIAHAQTRLH